MKITNKDFKMYNRSYDTIINLDKSPVTKFLGSDFKRKLIRNSDGVDMSISSFSDMEVDFSESDIYIKLNSRVEGKGDICII